jgi:uncharacterized protein (TIGR02391 family)
MITIVTELDRLYSETDTLRDWMRWPQTSHEATDQHARYAQRIYLAWFNTTRLLLPSYYHELFIEPFEGKPTTFAGLTSTTPHIRAYITDPLKKEAEVSSRDIVIAIASSSSSRRNWDTEERKMIWAYSFDRFFHEPFQRQINALLEARSYFVAEGVVKPLLPNAAPPLAGVYLHPRILAVAAERFASGHFDDAVENSILAVNEAVREKTGSDAEDGQSLMQHAFGPSGGTLRLSSNPKEQKAYMDLFVAAWGAVRNPRAHTTNSRDEAQAAIELIAFASALMRFVDAAEIAGSQ